jgi:hypothetical protein
MNGMIRSGIGGDPLRPQSEGRARRRDTKFDDDRHPDERCWHCSLPHSNPLRVCPRCAAAESVIVERLRSLVLDSPDGFDDALVFKGTGLPCSGCSKPITQSQWTFPASRAPFRRILRFHRWCARIWEVAGGHPAP